MLDVLCSKTIKQPEFQVLTCRVRLPNYDKLTPTSARAALSVAGYYTGIVSAYSTCGVYHKAYRIYHNSYRILYEYRENF